MTGLRGRDARLWGGPEDGATVWMPPGDLPARVGVIRDGAGLLVPLRGAGQLATPDPQVAVYEHLTRGVLRAWCGLMGAGGWESAGLDEPPTYIWRELVTRWTARE